MEARPGERCTGSVAGGLRANEYRTGGGDRQRRGPVRDARARARRGRRTAGRRTAHPLRRLPRRADARARCGRTARVRRWWDRGQGRARASRRGRGAARRRHGAVDRSLRDVRSAGRAPRGRRSLPRVRRAREDARRRAPRGRCRAPQRRLPARGRRHRPAAFAVSDRDRRSRAAPADRALVAGRAARHLRYARPAPGDPDVLVRARRLGRALRPYDRLDLGADPRDLGTRGALLERTG
jgi:hypothetical protein